MSELVGFLLQHQVDAAGFAQVPQVPFVQLVDNLLHRPRHGLETPLSAAVNGVGAFKRDHIAIPVGAFGAGWRLCSPDRYELVGLIHCWGFIGHACSPAGDLSHQLEAGQRMKSVDYCYSG